MSTPLAPLPIRLFCDLAAATSLKDLNRAGAQPSFYRGDDIEIDIGIGSSGSLLASLADTGAGGVASVTLQIFQAENDTDPPLISATVLGAAMNLSLTQAQWSNNTTPFYHAAFIIPSSQTAISLNGQPSMVFWLRITITTSDATAKTITILNGPVAVNDGPVSTASVPPLARFRAWTVSGQTVLQLLDASTGLYHTLAIYNDAGTLTLQLSDTGY